MDFTVKQNRWRWHKQEGRDIYLHVWEKKLFPLLLSINFSKLIYGINSIKFLHPFTAYNTNSHRFILWINPPFLSLPINAFTLLLHFIMDLSPSHPLSWNPFNIYIYIMFLNIGSNMFLKFKVFVKMVYYM